jgi:hypothetical protein
MEEDHLGEIRRGFELGFKDNDQRIYHACIDCGARRWIQLVKGQPETVRCAPCATKLLDKKLFITRGKNNPTWKGRSWTDKDGYVKLTIQFDDPFYSMADANHEVYEHRYIMAKHLSRCLTQEEIVDHKGTKYCYDSYEDHGDNRLENLDLITLADNTARTSIRLKECWYKIEKLEQMVTRRDAIIEQLRVRLK